jgi:Chaperone of endosialidase
LHNAGNFNTANGASALSNNTTGNDNTANGVGTLSSNTLGDDNVASGLSALSSNTSGGLNVAYGVEALLSNTTGMANTAIGTSALQNNVTGTGNIALGAGAGSGITTADFVIAIGEGLAGANVSGSCFIGNIRGVTTANADAIPVLIDSFGQLGTASSSRRFKKEIKAMESASEAILALKPVTFHYKTDTKDTPQFGLIAEEVGPSESGSGSARQERRDLHGALRRRERDVAQRVSQRTPQSRGAGPQA